MENMKISRIFYEKKLFVKVEMSLFAWNLNIYLLRTGCCGSKVEYRKVGTIVCCTLRKIILDKYFFTLKRYYKTVFEFALY